MDNIGSAAPALLQPAAAVALDRIPAAYIPPNLPVKSAPPEPTRKHKRTLDYAGPPPFNPPGPLPGAYGVYGQHMMYAPPGAQNNAYPGYVIDKENKTHNFASQIAEIDMQLFALKDRMKTMISELGLFIEEKVKNGMSPEQAQSLQDANVDRLRREEYAHSQQLQSRKQVLENMMKNEEKVIKKQTETAQLKKLEDDMRQEVRERLGGDVDEVEEAQGAMAYSQYQPSKFKTGFAHPDKLVESSSLHSTKPPDPSYESELKIFKDFEEPFQTSLSCAQLETISYAYQVSEDYFKLEAGGKEMRKGFFLGDGAGVGKGRQLAGFVKECQLNGYQKALWLSSSADLYLDARRDMDDIGMKRTKQLILKDMSYDKINESKGVLFATYTSLISKSTKKKNCTRLNQIVGWLGADFSGAIVLDECHKAKNLFNPKGKPTKTGEGVRDLQLLLPNARIIYSSATGCSEPSHMAYMLRLALWGDGTAFEDFVDFKNAVETSGVGMMELVALHLKRRGQYFCRTLSYDGSTFQIVQNDITHAQTEQYNASALMWQEIFDKIVSNFATDELAVRYLSMFPGWYQKDNENDDNSDAHFDDDDDDELFCAESEETLRIGPCSIKVARASIMRYYWGSHQRFFKSLCISLKVDRAIEVAKRALVDGNVVVIGLQSTGEAAAEAAQASTEFISAPNATLKRVITKLLPLPKIPLTDNILIATGRKKETDKGRPSRACAVNAPAAVNPFFLPRCGRLMEKKSVVLDLTLSDSDDEKLFDKTPFAKESDDISASETLSDDDSVDEESVDADSDFEPDASDSGIDDIACEVCKSEEEENMLLCDGCDLGYHTFCLIPEVETIPEGDWFCEACTNVGKGELAKIAVVSWERIALDPSVTVIVKDEEDEASDVVVEKKTPATKKRLYRVDSDSDSVTSFLEDDKYKSKKGKSDEVSLVVEMETSSVVEPSPNPNLSADPIPENLTAKEQVYLAAAAARKELFARVDQMSLPFNPLDYLIDKLGGPDMIAEMTGRKGRMVRLSCGKAVYRKRNHDNGKSLNEQNIIERKSFQSGRKKIAIISEAASAGISLHDDRRNRESRRRTHITLELAWSADRAIQQLGRSHRSNQTTAPEYVLLVSTQGGETRFASSVSKRLESLGALTQGDRRAASKGMNLSDFNFETKYGLQAVKSLIEILNHNRLDENRYSAKISMEEKERVVQHQLNRFNKDESVRLAADMAKRDSFRAYIKQHEHAVELNLVTNVASYRTQLTFPFVPREFKKAAAAVTLRDCAEYWLSSVGLDVNKYDPATFTVPRYLNRILGVPCAAQDILFNLFVERNDELIKEAKKAGSFDQGVKVIHGRNRLICATTIWEDKKDGKVVSETECTHSVLESDESVTWDEAFERYEEIRENQIVRNRDSYIENGAIGFYRSNNAFAGNHFLIMAYESVKTISTPPLVNILRPATGAHQMPRANLNNKYHSVSVSAAKEMWLSEYERTKENHSARYHLLSGNVIPLWTTVQKVMDRFNGLDPENKINIRVARATYSEPSSSDAPPHSPASSEDRIVTGLAMPKSRIDYVLKAIANLSRMPANEVRLAGKGRD